MKRFILLILTLTQMSCVFYIPTPHTARGIEIDISSIQVGVTTKEDIILKFGAPTWVDEIPLKSVDYLEVNDKDAIRKDLEPDDQGRIKKREDEKTKKETPGFGKITYVYKSVYGTPCLVIPLCINFSPRFRGIHESVTSVLIIFDDNDVVKEVIEKKDWQIRKEEKRRATLVLALID